MEKISCNHCQSLNFPNARYCSRCGYELPIKEIPLPVQTPTVVPKKKKFQFESIIGLLFGVLAYVAIQHFVFKKPAINKAMQQIANEMNRNCPMMVDSITQLSNVVVLPDNVLQYNYKLLNTEFINIEGLKEALEPSILNTIRTNPQMKELRSFKTTLNYSYSDENGVFLFKISVAPEDYAVEEAEEKS